MENMKQSEGGASRIWPMCVQTNHTWLQSAFQGIRGYLILGSWNMVRLGVIGPTGTRVQ